MKTNLLASFQHLYQRVSFVGVDSQGNDPYIDHKKLNNQNMLHFLMNLLILVPITIIFTANKTIFAYSFLLIPFVFLLYYLHLHHFKLARVFNIQIQVVLVFIAAILYGPQADLISFYFPILMKVFFLFKLSEKRSIYIHGTIIILFYVLYHFGQNYLAPYAIFSSQAKTIFYVTTPFKFINVVSIILIAFNRNNLSEIKLTTQKDYLQHIIDNLPLDIVILDQKFNYQFVNQKAEQDESTRKWLIGKNDYDYAMYKQESTLQADQKFTNYHQALASFTPLETEIITDTNGDKNYQLEVITPIQLVNSSQENCFIITRMDITRIKHSEEIIKKYAVALEQKNEELKQFAYIASHDLKSPLKNIIILLQLFIKKNAKQTEPKNLEFIQAAINSAEYLHRLVSDILLYATSEITDGDKELIDLKEVVETIQQNLKTIIDDKAASIQIKTPLPQMHLHRTLINNLLHNLIENGIKYNENPRPSILIDYQLEDKQHHFKVTDNGIGIKEEYKDQIFILFKRLTHEHAYEGTGIGLSICKKIVETYGGNIWMDSTTGVGTTFHFTIPMVA